MSYADIYCPEDRPVAVAYAYGIFAFAAPLAFAGLTRQFWNPSNATLGSALVIATALGVALAYLETSNG